MTFDSENFGEIVREAMLAGATPQLLIDIIGGIEADVEEEQVVRRHEKRVMDEQDIEKPFWENMWH